MAKREAVLRTLTSIRNGARSGVVLPLLFLLPLLFGIAGKLARSKLWFGDYQAVACAGLKAQAHQPIYALDLACPGMHPSVFVYIPGVAQIAAFFEGGLGEPGFFFLYAALFALSLVFLVAAPLRFAPGKWRDKLPFMVFVGGAAVWWGNIAVILHAVVLGAALLLETAPWVFVAVVAAAAMVKPVFLTYLVVIVLADMPWLKRATLCLVGVAAGLAPTAWFVITDPGTAFQWARILSHFVYEVTPGSGFYGWLSLLGLRSDTLAAQAAAFAYTAALALGALAAAHALKLNGRDRLWLGLSVATLLIPRIMSQDVFLLGPGLIIAARRATELMATRSAPDEKWTRALLGHSPAIVWSLCFLALVFGSIEHSRYSTPLALLGFSLYLIGLGAALSAAPIARQIRSMHGLLPQPAVADPETRS